MNTFDVSCFMHHSSFKSFTAEASEIPRFSGLFGPIFEDIAMKGFWMMNPKTKNKVKFYFSNVVRNHKLEVQYWLFKITEESIRKFPSMAGYVVKVFND